MRIRAANEDDLESILRLDKSIEEDALNYDGILDYYEDADGEPTRASIDLDWRKADEKEREILVTDFEDDEEIAGYIIIERHPQTMRLWILDIVVLHSHSRKGVGTALAKYVIEAYPNYKVFATVNSKNTEALEFITSLGLRPILTDILLSN